MDEATKVRAEEALNTLKRAAEKVHAREAEEASKKNQSELRMNPSEMPQLGLQALKRAAEKVHSREAEEANKDHC